MPIDLTEKFVKKGRIGIYHGTVSEKRAYARQPHRIFESDEGWVVDILDTREEPED